MDNFNSNYYLKKKKDTMYVSKKCIQTSKSFYILVSIPPYQANTWVHNVRYRIVVGSELELPALFNHL